MKVGIKYIPYRTVDTVELARILFPTQKSYRLVDLSNSLNLYSGTGYHNALIDVEVTVNLLKKIAEKIQYIERKTGEIKIEKVMGEKALEFLYYNPFGKLALETVVKRKFLSDWYGKKMSKPESKEKIKSFIEEMEINMKDYKRPVEDYKNFNDFFYRELKDGARIIDFEESLFWPRYVEHFRIADHLFFEKNYFERWGERFQETWFLSDLFSFLQENEEVPVAIIKALERAKEFAKNNPDEVFEIFAKSNIPAEIFKKAYSNDLTFSNFDPKITDESREKMQKS